MNQPHYRNWIHGMSIESGRVVVVQETFRLEQVNASRFTASSQGVDEDDQLPILDQGVGQIVTANAEIHDTYMRWEPQAGEALGHFDSKRIVAQEDVPDAGDE